MRKNKFEKYAYYVGFAVLIDLALILLYSTANKMTGSIGDLFIELIIGLVFVVCFSKTFMVGFFLFKEYNESQY